MSLLIDLNKTQLFNWVSNLKTKTASSETDNNVKYIPFLDICAADEISP